MSFDREDFDAMTEKKATERLKNNQPALELLHQAKVRTSLLTQSPEWDTFLQMLQDAIEKNGAARDTYVQRLLQIDTSSDVAERMRRLAQQCNTRIETIQGIMALPKQIHDAGTASEEALSTLKHTEGA